jgi:tetratricopeptide (TPR) repeat protein
MSVPTFRHRKLRLIAILLCFFFSWNFASASAQMGKPEVLYYKSWAVIVGIENYLVAPKVPGAIEEAKTVAQALRQLGFEEVVELYDKDASFRRLQQTLTDFLPRKVGRQDRLILYFVGHAGISQDLTGNDLGYLVPWDAQLGSVSKSITFEQLKEFTRRTASKHTLLIFDAAVRGWEETAAQQLSLEGRSAPEEDTEKRVVQVLTAADKGETLSQAQGKSVFVQSLIDGLKGRADQNKNGWLMASELAGYVKQQVEQTTQGKQHPVFSRLEGDGDTILVEGRKAAFVMGAGPQTPAERHTAAKTQYEQAFALLQAGKSADEALERLNKAIEYDPAFGDAYVLKSYVRFEVLPNLDEAMSAAKLAVQHAPNNPDSHYTLGLIQEKRGNYQEAERAMRDAVAVNPNYADVYLSLGELYADQIKDQPKAVEAFRRYLDLGGNNARARAAVEQAGPAKQ